MNHLAATLFYLLHHYGSFGVFTLLALGIIALPIPDETLLLLAGTLVKSQQFFFIPAWLAVMLGAIIGISLSYFIGRTAGHFTVSKLCLKFGIDKSHIEQTQSLFNRIGPWVLLTAYFIPLLRHLSGLIAGTTHLPYKIFALFAYAGALLWSNLFFWLGFLYGMAAFHLTVKLYERYGLWLIGGAILLASIILVMVYREKKHLV